MHGRGTYDMKGGLAAAMLAVAGCHGLAGDVVLAAVCDEEAAGLGTHALLASGRAFDAAVVTEPTDLDVVVAHKGYAGFAFETSGVTAHGSRPDLGDDAILKMGPVLQALTALDAELRGACASDPGHGQPACLVDRRGPGGLELPCVLPADRGLADGSG